MPTQTNIGPLETKVTAFKLIARDALRMNMISPRLSNLSDLQNRITDLSKGQAAYNHSAIVANYEISKLDKEHPDYEEKKAKLLERVKNATEYSEDITKQIAEVQKEIDEQNTGIAKIESGETKVSLDDLNSLTERLVKEDAFKQVNQ